MKLIESIFLRFKEGNSDKEYKAEIFEVSADNYLVKFAFGKAGSTLKDNSKTDNPVSLDDAKKIYNDLVNSKIKKGYKKIRSFSIDDSQKQALKYTPDKQKEEVLKKLSAEYIASLNLSEKLNDAKKIKITNMVTFRGGDASKVNNQAFIDKQIGRNIWRAGELKIKEALPLLLNLLDYDDKLIKYSVIWSIGLCGDSSVLNKLTAIIKDDKSPEMIVRIAEEAFLKLADEKSKTDFINEKVKSLPNHLKDLILAKKFNDFNYAYNLYISKPENIKKTLEILYYIDEVRETVINNLKALPLRSHYFKAIRHIFKMAEYRSDAEVFGIIAKRFETEKSSINNFNNYSWNSSWGYMSTDYGDLRSSEIIEELKKDNSRFAYTQKTKEYMLKRVVRTLRKSGEDNNPDFVKMAVGTLLSYDDSDAVVAKETSKYYYNYDTRRGYTKKSIWDKYAPFQALNYLLYKNSQRYGKEENSRAWKCINNYKPGDPEPDSREEAFPELWNTNPGGLIHLLAESNCEPVHLFAIKALKELKDVWAKIDVETLILLLEKPYQATADFAFELIKEKYDPQNPDLLIVKTLINSVSIVARDQGLVWIGENKDFYFKDIDFIFSLMISEFDNVRDFIKNSALKLSDSQNEIIIVKLISYLMTNVKDYKKAQDMSENLKINYAIYLKNIGLEIIKDLLNAPLEPLQEFGAFLFSNHNTKVEDMPYELLQTMIDSGFESVRGLGVKFIGDLPDSTAILRIPLIISLATHKLADIRMETRTLIEKIINQINVGEKLTEELINNLLDKELWENLHADIVYLLSNQLKQFTDNLGLEYTVLLIKSPSKDAQELGGKIFALDRNVENAMSLNLIDIVRMANHEILSVREASWKILNFHAQEIIADKHTLGKVMRFFDAKREDSRNYARDVFSKNFSDKDWTTELLIGLCDSLYADVRNFGRMMIEKMFKSEDGLEYLTKLSEHPSTDMQLFATNYIGDYAGSDKEKIKELIPYFKRVLANVNRSRTAKNKILEYLKNQAKNDLEIAKLVNEIIYWYSGTNSVNDKARAIEMLIDIKMSFPEIEELESFEENNEFNHSFGKLKIKEIEIRNGN